MTHQFKPILKTSATAAVTSNSIAPVLQQRFNFLNIPLDNTILGAIANYHSSQVQAALNHVEANFELIKSTTAVFLYQLPKQPIEDNQPLLPVYTAANFAGFTIEHMKAWYPNHWQEAALHFGLTLE